jgi:hypothetical protein
MNTKGVNFQPSKRGQFSAAVDRTDYERQDERLTVTKKALAALGIGMIATGAALTIAFGVAHSATSSPGGPR